MVRLGSIVVLSLFGVGCVTDYPGKDQYMSGAELLTESIEQEETSRAMILDAAALRKEISGLHKQKRSAADKQQVQALIEKKSEQMSFLQKEGANKRAAAGDKFVQATSHFKKGMMERMGGWIADIKPLGLASGLSDETFRAHNPRLASADPSIIRRQADIDQASQSDSDRETMSLIRDAMSDQNAPEDLDIGTFQLSRERELVGHIEVHQEEGGDHQVPVNKIHQWRLIITDLNGNPVETAVEVIGHMPGHVHGLPTAPKVTKSLAPGVYLIEGVKFQMRGWWVMEFDTGEDRLRFNMVL